MKTINNNLINVAHHEQIRYRCEFCGSTESNLDFKGKKVCEDCLKYFRAR